MCLIITNLFYSLHVHKYVSIPVILYILSFLDDDDSGTLAAILGVVIGAIVVLLLLGIVVLLVIKFQKKKQSPKGNVNNYMKILLQKLICAYFIPHGK